MTTTAPVPDPADASDVAPTEVAPVEVATDAPPARRPRRVRRFIAAFVVGLATVLVVTGAGLAAWDAGYAARILPGVHVGSLDLSGMDRATASEALATAFAFDQGWIVLRAPGVDIAVPYSAFGRRPDVGAMVDRAMAAGRDGDVAVRAVGQVRQALGGTTLPPRLALDGAKLAAAITSALGPLERTPVDARITMGTTGSVITPSRDGLTADPAPVIAAALAAVGQADAPAEVVIPVTTAVVPPLVSDAAVLLAADRAQRLVDKVIVTYSKKSWTIPAATVRGWVSFLTAVDGSVHPIVDPDRIAAALATVAKGVATKAQSASFLTNRSGTVVGVAAGKDGRALDVDATVGGIVSELVSRMAGTAPAPVKAAWVAVAPALTTEEAQKSAPLLTKLGTWTTWFPISDHNFYGANIWIPAKIIDGTVLAPGHTFDWWQAVGPVSTARGFGPGGVIAGDHTDPTGALGGGMCSSSTTLFNAALRAGLQMGARGNHRYYINRYPLGLDATVWIEGGATQSMSFTNDTAHAILIRGIRTRSGGRGYVTYEIWGVPDGRTVTILWPVVTNILQAVTNTVQVTTLPHGVVQQTEYPSNGMDTSVTRIVHDASGRVIHEETWRSHYTLWNGLIQVGA